MKYYMVCVDALYHLPVLPNFLLCIEHKIHMGLIINHLVRISRLLSFSCDPYHEIVNSLIYVQWIFQYRESAGND